MDLISSQISEIKNLNLIYVFTTDSIFKDKLNKYVGARVVFNKNQVFSLDYKNEHFSEFIKRIIDRYNKEKDKRNIVLLGDLTKKLVNDPFFSITDERALKQKQIPLFNIKDNELMRYQRYLEKALKAILKVIKGYDTVCIDSINGYNYKYVINYSVGIYKKSVYSLLFISENGDLDFKISNIEGINVDIIGSIKDNLNFIEINWTDFKNNFAGNIIYDSENKLTEEKISQNENTIMFNDSCDTLLDEDQKIIDFYFNLCELEQLKNVLKIDDDTYLLSDSNILINDEDGIFQNIAGCEISLFKDKVNVKHSVKNGISKYNDQVKVLLEENVREFNFRKINLNNKFYILLEKKVKINDSEFCSYDVLSLDSEKDLRNIFSVSERYSIDDNLVSLDKAKEYIKKYERSKK